MNFTRRHHYGKDFFYPMNEKAKKFIEAFPHSNGKRKSLTIEQMQIMQEMEVPFIVRENLKKESLE